MGGRVKVPKSERPSEEDRELPGGCPHCGFSLVVDSHHLPGHWWCAGCDRKWPMKNLLAVLRGLGPAVIEHIMQHSAVLCSIVRGLVGYAGARVTDQPTSSAERVDPLPTIAVLSCQDRLP
eukprot:g1729.t1